VAEKKEPRAAPARSSRSRDASESLTARLARCYTGAVHDVLREMGHEKVVLPAAIKPLVPEMRIAGPAWTVAGHIDLTLSRHETLLAWCTLLSRAPKGHVVVCQPNNHEVALMGELSAQTLQARGVLGFVVDGGSRDTELAGSRIASASRSPSAQLRSRPAIICSATATAWSRFLARLPTKPWRRPRKS